MVNNGCCASPRFLMQRVASLLIFSPIPPRNGCDLLPASTRFGCFQHCEGLEWDFSKGGQVDNATSAI